MCLYLFMMPPVITMNHHLTKPLILMKSNCLLHACPGVALAASFGIALTQSGSCPTVHQPQGFPQKGLCFHCLLASGFLKYYFFVIIILLLLTYYLYSPPGKSMELNNLDLDWLSRNMTPNRSENWGHLLNALAEGSDPGWTQPQCFRFCVHCFLVNGLLKASFFS
jgi:hypothetical protein